MYGSELVPVVLSGVVASVQVELDHPDLPRTHVTLDTAQGEVVLTLPGANGPPVVVGGVPTILPGQEWQVEVQDTPAGLVPVGLGRGMTLLAGPPSPPWALNGLSYSDEQLPIVFELNQDGSEELGIDATEAVALAALEAWTGVGCSRFAFEYGGRTDLGFDDDGVNVLSWENDSWDWGGQVAGLTATRFDVSTGEVIPVGADIVFNGVDWSWSADSGDVYVNPPTLHAGSVVLHELGHVTGMDHELQLVGSTMFFAYIGGTWQGSLAGDDRRGLCENYATGTAECAEDADCAGIDDQERACVEIDGVGVCDEVRDPVGAFCSRTVFNCAEACVFTNNVATEGYCSVGCESDEDCPDGYACGQAGLFLYDDPVQEEWLCLQVDEPEPGDSGDTGPTSDGGAGGVDSGDETSAEGCACQGAAAPSGLLLPLLPLVLRRRRIPSAILRSRPLRSAP